MDDHLGGIAVFIAIAESSGFRAAGDRLGVSGSAVSQALRRFEERLGVALVQRTTRSVRLTEAGERLYAVARAPLEELREAVAGVVELANVPRGTVRLGVSPGAENFLQGPTLEGFVRSFPDIVLDIVVDEEDTDIVAAGYDAGVRLGEVIDRDMIAVPASGMQRLAVVASPGYFVTHPIPKHPRDLMVHSCLNWRATAKAPPYRWEFTEKGHDFTVAVSSRIVTTDGRLLLQLARAGLGPTITFEDMARPYLDSGELVEVLEEFCAPFPGYYLYYPQRRQASSALRALIDYVAGAHRGRRPRR
jgi:DNA-binding transcriptional LysR family regulator